MIRLTFHTPVVRRLTRLFVAPHTCQPRCHAGRSAQRCVSSFLPRRAPLVRVPLTFPPVQNSPVRSVSGYASRHAPPIYRVCQYGPWNRPRMVTREGEVLTTLP